MYQQDMNNPKLPIELDEIPNTLAAAQEALFMHTDEFSQLIENWELDNAKQVLHQMINCMAILQGE